MTAPQGRDLRRYLAGKALVAQSVELSSDRATGAGPAAILDNGDDELGMYGGSFDWGELRWWRISLLCIAGCAAV